MKQIVGNLIYTAAAVSVLSALPGPVSLQTRAPRPPETVRVQPLPEAPAGLPTPYGDDTSERSIKADPAVKLEVCVSQGRLRVNGWKRNEVRIYVQNGNRFSFNVREKNETTSNPNWITITGVATRGNYAVSADCISAEDIEIDVPMGAVLAIKGRDFATSIDSVRKVEITNIGGGISLKNISAGINATAGRGDLTVENSSGPIYLDTTTGNIVVFEASPGEIGDLLKVKTNGGTISIQAVQHRQLEARSISGSVFYDGKIRPGGSYRINTNKGSIRMLIPGDSSGQLQATFGAGNFSSELNIRFETENVAEGPMKTIVGRFGTGSDASIKLTTHSGSINIKKQ